MKNRQRQSFYLIFAFLCSLVTFSTSAESSKASKGFQGRNQPQAILSRSESGLQPGSQGCSISFVDSLAQTETDSGDGKKIDQPPVPGRWRLTLSEDFENKQNQLDVNLWTKNMVYDGGLGASMFIKEGVLVKNGQLHIITRRAPAKSRSGKAFKFTSGLIQTFGKFTQKHGYFEAKMTLPTTKGMWPAFWLMPDRKGCGDLNRWWAAGRRSTYVEDGSNNGYTGQGMEIDIMEHLTVWGPNRFSSAIHWDGYGQEHKKSGDSYDVPPSEDGSRIFGLYWRPNLLVWFIDDKEVNRIESDRISDVPMYILINTSVGGWDGNNVSETSKFPVRTTVDWIRVWSQDD